MPYTLHCCDCRFVLQTALQTTGFLFRHMFGCPFAWLPRLLGQTLRKCPCLPCFQGPPTEQGLQDATQLVSTAPRALWSGWIPSFPWSLCVTRHHVTCPECLRHPHRASHNGFPPCPHPSPEPPQYLGSSLLLPLTCTCSRVPMATFFLSHHGPALSWCSGQS